MTFSVNNDPAVLIATESVSITSLTDITPVFTSREK